MSAPECDECGEHPTDCKCDSPHIPGSGFKWTKFKDGAPTRHVIFITNWVSVWTESIYADLLKYFATHNPEYAWAEIPLPEVPKEEVKRPHHCENDSRSFAYGDAITECWENEEGTLIAGNGEYGSKVNYCPVCGYKAKE